MPKPESHVEIDEVTVVVKAPDGASTPPENCKIIDALRIYPLRFGVYKKGQVDELYCTDGTPTSLDARGSYPSLEQEHDYYYHAMPLRNGWLYVSCKDSDGVYEYLHLNQSYKLVNFITNKEGAKPLYPTDTITDFIPATSSTKMYFFYTEIQLLKKHVLEKFFEGKKLKLTNSFDCKAWSESDGVSLSDITKRRLDPLYASIVVPETSEAYFKYDVKKYDTQFKSIVKRNSREITKNRDVFFVVDDIFGVTEQMRIDLNALHIEHESIIRSTRTGIASGILKERMLQSKEEKITDEILVKDLVEPNQLKQVAMAHTIAMLVYRMAYNPDSPSYIRRAQRSIDRNVIMKMLAIKERAEIKKLIEKKRKALAAVIDCDKFQDLCEFYSNVVKDETSDITKYEYNHFIKEAKGLMVEAYQDLSVLPHTKDAYLELPNVDKEYIDPCHETFKTAIEKTNKVGLLLYAPIDIDEYAYQIDEDEAKADISINSVIVLTDFILNTWQQQAFTEFKIKLAVSIIKKIKYVDGNGETQYAFQVNKTKVRRLLKSKGQTKLTQVKNVGKTKWQIEALSKKDYSKDLVKVKVKKTNTSKADRIFKKLCTNKLYLGTMSGLAMLSVGDIIKEGDNDWKKTLARSIEFSATMAVLQRRHAAASLEAKFVQGRKARIAKGIAVKTIGRQINVLCGIGAYAGVAFDVFNAIETGESEDYDAMAFHIISAGAGLTAGTISLFYASAAWAGPVGIGAAVVMFLGKIAADYFTDTELEKFINKTILSNKLKIKVNPSTVMVQTVSPYGPISTPVVSTVNGEPYELIEKITLEKWREKRVKKYDFYKDYHFLLEDLMYTQLLIPFFKVGVNYELQPNLNKAGRTINNVIGFNTTISAGLVQAGLNVAEIDVHPYYAIDRVNWLGFSDAYVTLFATNKNTQKIPKPLTNYKRPDPTEEALKRGTFFYQYSCYDQKRLRIFKRQEAFIIVLIRLKLADGTFIPSDRPNSKEVLTPQYLIYRYKIDLTEKMNYFKPEVSLDKTYIGEYRDANM